MSKWPSSDLRIDTAHASVGATLDPGVFSNVVGMPILMELFVNRIKDLAAGNQPDPSKPPQYDYTICAGYQVRDGKVEDDVRRRQLSQDQSQFIHEYADRYYPGFFASSTPSISAHYGSFRKYLKDNNNTQQIGSYISGAYCRDHPTTDFFPAAIIDSHAITPLGHTGLTGTEAKEDWSHYLDEWKTWNVNPADAPNIAKFQDLLVNQALACNADFLFLDNMLQVSYLQPTKSDEADAAEAFIRHTGILSKRLNALGIGMVCNLGKLPYWPRDFQSYPYLEGLFDDAMGSNGIYLENPFRYLDNASLTEWEIGKYRSLLNQGGSVVLSPYPEGYEDLARAEWLAALGLLTREPGNALFLSTDCAIINTDSHWRDWPCFFGRPTTAWVLNRCDDNTWFVRREFGTDKEITVVHIYAPGPDAVVEMPVPIDAGYQVIPGRGPTRGKWDHSPDPSSMSSTYTVDSDPHLYKDRDDGYSDRFILGTNLDAVRGFYQKMVAVDVIIQSTIYR